MESEDSRASSTSFNRRWKKKFQVAVAGLVSGIQGRRESQFSNSFLVHIPVGFMVVLLAWLLGVGWNSMAVLVLCIGMVLVTELINTSLELIGKAVTDEENAHVGAALDVASGAVLMASLTAVAVGLIVFGRRLVEWLGG